MKEAARNLGYFIVFCIVFSSLTACGGLQSNSANTAASNQGTNSNSAASDAKSTAYPMLASGLADAEIELLDGTKTSISAEKGKVIMVNIWGIWCGPCRAEMPHLVDFKKKYGDEGFEILGLNIGDQNGSPEPVENIKQFGDQMKINYTLARSPRETTNQLYMVTKQQVVPQTLLVDREGHLRGVFIGSGDRIYDSMQKEIDKIMAQ